eukprot:TRINITY_DN33929_c0_g1_i1.p1 TRINITY_DN33929_c0_g1~~TRINITY_DN33929_c0_g1_i1.p1  ORF type:complete len:441 (-),score=97.59 TRINITY_DN33929_c0_g1_i1:54-1376(-)
MDAVARIFRGACPPGSSRIPLDQLREALRRVAGEKIGVPSIDALLEDAMYGVKTRDGFVEVETFLAWLSSRAENAYLAGLAVCVPHIDQLKEPLEPHFTGTIEEFRQQHADDSATQERLRNTVKICGRCGKPCAYTLFSCNSCGASLEGVDKSYNDNVFMGFVYGIAKGKFPYKISMRAQTPDFLCFDDPLQCSPVHLNAIPTSVYCPDLRYLFSDPPRGLALLNELLRTASQVALQQYWDNEAFREKIWGGSSRPASQEELSELVVLGLNFPPSMYQLHLQFIHMPMLPFHYNMLQVGEHFTYGRFFPLFYLQKALGLGDAVKMTVTDDTDICDIMAMVTKAGVSYDDEHAAHIARAHAAHQRFCPWREDDFTHCVISGRVYDKARRCEQPGLDLKEVQKSDSLLIQNYGRPYDENGKPTGTYYKFAKDPKDVISFVQP